MGSADKGWPGHRYDGTQRSPWDRWIDGLTVVALGFAIAIGAALFGAAYVVWIVETFT